MVDIVAVNTLLVLLYMTAFFAVAKKRNRLDTVDVAWGGGFVLLAWATFWQRPNFVSFLVAFMVSIWGVRLASHILRRVRRHSQDDPRYAAMAKKWKGNYWLRAYTSVFLLQGLLILLVGAPIMAAAGDRIDNLWWLGQLGVTVWSLGYIIEYRADQQLAAFLASSANKGKVLDSGLWRYSRHPNYFGELMQWWGIGIVASQAAWGWIGFIGPLVLTILIVFVSGIPPIEKRRKDDPNYQAYKRRTSSLIPLPRRG